MSDLALFFCAIENFGLTTLYIGDYNSLDTTFRNKKLTLKVGVKSMRCQFCGHIETKVLETRLADEGAAVRRRRECEQCARRFTTYENCDEIPLVVVKKEGQRELFERNKILNGMLKACEKRPISVEVLEEATNEIEKKLRNNLEREVSSQEIGELIMDKLAEIDEVAYIRFASVYRQFKDVNRFIQELQDLVQRKQ